MSNDTFATSSNLPDGMTFADLPGYFDEIDIEPPDPMSFDSDIDEPDDYGDRDEDYDPDNDTIDDGKYGTGHFPEEDK